MHTKCVENTCNICVSYLLTVSYTRAMLRHMMILNAPAGDIELLEARVSDANDTRSHRRCAFCNELERVQDLTRYHGAYDLCPSCNGVFVSLLQTLLA